MSTKQRFIKRGEAKDLLNISDEAFGGLVKEGLIRKRTLPGMKYGQYIREDVERLVEYGVATDAQIETKIKKLVEQEV